jgi:hypothetical protein
MKTSKLIIAIFFLGINSILGQDKVVLRTVNDLSIETRYPNKPMKFYHNGNDTIYLSILEDKSDKELSVRLYVYFPEEAVIKQSGMTLVYSDGSEEFLPEDSAGIYIGDKNYKEYTPESNGVNLRNKKVKQIKFPDGSMCYDVRHPYYFVDFLK